MKAAEKAAVKLAEKAIASKERAAKKVAAAIARVGNRLASKKGKGVVAKMLEKRVLRARK